MNLSLYGISWIGLFFWVGIGCVGGILADDVYKYYEDNEKAKNAIVAITGFLSFTLFFIFVAGDIPTFLNLLAAGAGVVLSLFRHKLHRRKTVKLPKEAIRVLR